MRRLISDARGVTAIEYAILASLIAVAILAGVGQVGTNAAATFARIAAVTASL